LNRQGFPALQPYFETAFAQKGATRLRLFFVHQLHRLGNAWHQVLRPNGAAARYSVVYVKWWVLLSRLWRAPF
jgi:hypothetical protein